MLGVYRTSLDTEVIVKEKCKELLQCQKIYSSERPSEFDSHPALLGANERAIHLGRPLLWTHRESIASKTDTPLLISLALHPAKPSSNAGFCSYLLTYEEIGTTSKPSCF